DTHSVLISWGSGEGTTSLADADLTNLGNGDWGFTASHQYLDDNPTGTPSDSYAVTVAVADDDGGPGTGGTSGTVANEAPSNIVLNSGTINENDSFNLTGSFTDPGTPDSHTVVIDWGPGEGTTTLNLAAGVLTFGAAHQYLDDNPSGSASDTYPISVTVTDENGSTPTRGRAEVVTDLAPPNTIHNYPH